MGESIDGLSGASIGSLLTLGCDDPRGDGAGVCYERVEFDSDRAGRVVAARSASTAVTSGYCVYLFSSITIV